MRKYGIELKYEGNFPSGINEVRSQSSFLHRIFVADFGGGSVKSILYSRAKKWLAKRVSSSGCIEVSKGREGLYAQVFDEFKGYVDSSVKAIFCT
jgi:hypothetical protein